MFIKDKNKSESINKNQVLVSTIIPRAKNKQINHGSSLLWYTDSQDSHDRYRVCELNIYSVVDIVSEVPVGVTFINQCCQCHFVAVLVSVNCHSQFQQPALAPNGGKTPPPL